MSEWTHLPLATTAEVIDLIGVAIMLVGAVKFLLLYLGIEAKRLLGRDCVTQTQAARQVLGGYILVALELLIVSDVITSVVSRSLESLAELGAIVVLRTVMSFFLARELSEGEPA